MIEFQVTFLALVLLSVGSIYAPTLLLGRGEQLSRDDMIAVRPNLAYVRWLYPLVHAIWILSLFALAALFASLFAATAGARALYPIATFPAGAALFDGVFSLSTGVRAVATKGGYRFTDAGASRAVPLCQVVAATGLICSSVALALL